jgi:hypothetical protein
MSQVMGAVSPSNFQNKLAGIDFPAGRDELSQQARDNQAVADVMAAYHEIGVR